MKYSLLFTQLLFLSVTMAQTNPTIEGSAKGKHKEAIPFANIYIPTLKQGTMADEEGMYTLTIKNEGIYKIEISAIGFVTKTIEASFISNQINTYNIVLEFDNSLEQVEVFGRRNSHPDKIEALTRLPLAPHEQIQSISVISEKLIEKQGALTISDATKNVPGVYTFATYGNKRESISSRGFRGIPILKNGVRVHSDFRGVGILTDMQGVDNIQVLKGAAAITQGLATDLGSPGGVVNIVTKTPKYRFGGQVSQRLGSYGLTRTTVDVYGPLNEKETIAYRFNGAIQRSDSYRSGISSQRFYINPSLEFKIDDKSKLTLELDHFYDSRTPDIGTVNLDENDTNAIYDLPHHQFLGFENDKAITKNTTYSVRFDRILSDKLTLKAAYYASQLDLQDKGASLGGAIATNDEIQYNLRQRGYSNSYRKDDNSTLQLDLVGKDIQTGAIKHTFQIGLDYRTTNASTGSETINVVDTLNVFKANSSVLPSISFQNENLSFAETNALGFVVQDVISWNKWLNTFIGLRYSTTETITVNEITSSDTFSPLVGFVVSPVSHLNVFASYTNSAYPRTGSRIDINGNALGNERFDQFEAGLKTSWYNDRLRFNATYFKINNRNINLPVYDSNFIATGFYEKGGNDQRQGIELELTGRILENLTAVAGYSFIDAQYKEHTSFVYGSSPLNTPSHTANLYLDYNFTNKLKGLALGGGIYYTGDRPVNDWSAGAISHEGIIPNQEPFNIASFTQVDLQASYTFNEHWSGRLLVNNLFDEIGYNAYRTRFINQTDPRTLSAVISYNF
ncbi:iron complex outermembrane receptor protein [Dokdonia sp. Hel_I_63]|uniref:TonB-dependent receptor n=1 Tax=Dokdonia sp. Hel_I_63 TaxID=1249996 RepID=UPI0011996E6E|nr:TonB-dependent receptor [Dokdonia sp. Hel_I_63]TVZ23330.1 iron complex outermembrane receptor protein [Dokdonia sp. Hel_I_63]